jgi:hypothetical protein
MDTLRDMEVLNEQWATGAAPWNVWSEQPQHRRLQLAA